MILRPSVFSATIIRPNITRFELGDSSEGNSLGRSKVPLPSRRCSTEEASHERGKDRWFTDVASRYDRVEASVGKALYSAHPQRRWISDTSSWISLERSAQPPATTTGWHGSNRQRALQ